MDSFDIVMGGALIALVIFQLALSIRVGRSDMYDRQQKVWQIQLIWLLPVLGAGVVFYILRDAEAHGPKAR